MAAGKQLLRSNPLRLRCRLPAGQGRAPPPSASGAAAGSAAGPRRGDAAGAAGRGAGAGPGLEPGQRRGGGAAAAAGRPGAGAAAGAEPPGRRGFPAAAAGALPGARRRRGRGRLRALPAGPGGAAARRGALPAPWAARRALRELRRAPGPCPAAGAARGVLHRTKQRGEILFNPGLVLTDSRGGDQSVEKAGPHKENEFLQRRKVFYSGGHARIRLPCPTGLCGDGGGLSAGTAHLEEDFLVSGWSSRTPENRSYRYRDVGRVWDSICAGANKNRPSFQGTVAKERTGDPGVCKGENSGMLSSAILGQFSGVFRCSLAKVFHSPCYWKPACCRDQLKRLVPDLLGTSRTKGG